MSKGSDDLAKSVICRLRGEKDEVIRLLESALEAGLEGKEKVDALYTLGRTKMTAIGNDVSEEVFQKKYNEGVDLMEKAVMCDAQEGNGFFLENRSYLSILDAAFDLQAKNDIRKSDGFEAEVSFRKQKLSLFTYLKSTPLIITLGNLGSISANNGKPELARQYWQQVLDAEVVDPDSKMEAETREAVREELQILNANNPPKKSDEGGCYIATACYGSYDAPEVRLLRKYRDKELLPHPLGRLFVRLYYQISPALANKLKEMPNLNNFIRRYILDRTVKILSK